MADISSKNPIKASVGYTIANVLIKGVSFVTLPIFTRLLSTAEYGQYSMFVMYESILTVVVSFCIYSSLNTAKAKFNEKLDDYLSSVLLIPIIFALFLLIVACVMYLSIGDNELFGINGYMYPLLVLYSFGTATLGFYNNRASIDYSYLNYLFISIVNTILNITLSLALIIWVFPDNAIKGRVSGSTGAILLIAVCIVIYFFRRSRPQINVTYWKFAVAFSAPLVIHGFAQLLLSQFGKVAIQSYYESEIVGLYGFALTISQIPNVIITSLSTVWTPWFFENYGKGKITEINNTSQKCIKLFSIGFVGCVCILPEVIKIMAPKEYWASIELVVPVVMIYYFIFLYNIVVQVEYYHRKTDIIGTVTMMAAIFNVVFDLIAAKYIGYHAVPYVSVISYILYYLFHASVVKRIEGNELFDYRRINLSAMLSLCSMIAMNCFSYSLYKRVLVAIVFFLILYIPDRKELNSFVVAVLRKMAIKQ